MQNMSTKLARSSLLSKSAVGVRQHILVCMSVPAALHVCLLMHTCGVHLTLDLLGPCPMFLQSSCRFAGKAEDRVKVVSAMI